jgi:hypothetical protein
VHQPERTGRIALQDGLGKELSARLHSQPPSSASSLFDPTSAARLRPTGRCTGLFASIPPQPLPYVVIMGSSRTQCPRLEVSYLRAVGAPKTIDARSHYCRLVVARLAHATIRH